MSEADAEITTTVTNVKLIASLAAAHAAIGALLIELTESPPAPADLVPAPVSGGGAPPLCKHSDRKDLRAFGETEHWECRKCGYEYRR